MTDYEQFLATKKRHAQYLGFDAKKLTRKGAKFNLFDWQQHVVRIALKAGRFALFEDCGLGKSAQQLIWADEVAKHTKGPVLILCPLAVAAQTVSEGVKFGVKVTHIREAEELGKTGIYITNYDRLEKFAAEIPRLSGIVLDESSILKNFMGKTRIMLTEMFANTPYRLACTATPAPNDFMELGQHCEFLGIMRSNEMLSRWFINDTMNFGKYRLKGHARADFWEWVGSWAACINHPSDIGFSDDGYNLPPLELHNCNIQVDEVTGAKEGELFRATSISAVNLQKEARFSLKERCEMAVEIAMREDSPCILWCELNDESDELAKLLKEKLPEGVEFVEVRGSDTSMAKETKLNQFGRNEVRYMVTKPEMGGFGMNFQHCHRQVFAGQSFSMEREYQAIRRSYRFGQLNPVHIHFIAPATLGDVRARVKEKFQNHERMKKEMSNAAKTLSGKRELTMKEDIDKIETRRWTVYHGDCVRAAKLIGDNTIDFSVYSPPFANLYIYSSDAQDMGNTSGHAEFMEQYKFLIKEKLRITKPGCLSAVHCKQTVKYSGRDGDAGLVDFRGMIIKAHEELGWTYHSEFLIWKDPVIEMQRTKAQGLLFKQLCRDSRFSRAGMPEYLLIFRKWAEGMKDEPVVHNDKEDWKYIGSEGPPAIPDGEILEDNRGRNIQIWQRYASPVWMDIRQTNVLNIAQARESNDEKHICPLQLDVIERAVWLYTKHGDLVYSPFTGIGSEGYTAIKMGRNFVGSELKESYFRDAAQWLKQAESEQELNLFELPAAKPEETLEEATSEELTEA